MHRPAAARVHLRVMTSSLRWTGVSTLMALVLASCSGTGTLQSDRTTIPLHPPTTSEADSLTTGLISAPASGGPWTVQPDDGVPVNLMQPVCGVPIPNDVPRSLAHAGRMFFSGEPSPLTAESFPIARHSRDRFADATEAAAFIDIHRQALTTCDSWTYEDDEVTIDYAVTMIDIALPGNGVAFQVTEQRDTERLVNLTAMYQQNDIVSVLYYVALDEADQGTLEELIAEAEVLREVNAVYETLELEKLSPIVVTVEEINHSGLWLTRSEQSVANDP